MSVSRRILFLLQPGTNSRWIFQDLIAGFERAGHTPVIFELGPLWQMYQAEKASGDRLKSHMTQLLIDTCRSNRIDAAMGMWANSLMTFVNPTMDGKPVNVFEALGLPHALYWLDAPHWAHDGGIRASLGTSVLRGEKMHHFINNRATAREMRTTFAMGNVHALNYGINEQVFTPRHAEPEFDCVFGTGPGDAAPTPAALEELEKNEPDLLRVRRDLAERIGPKLDEISSQSPVLRDVLRELLKLQITERDSPMLDRVERLTATGGTLAHGAAMLVHDPRVYIAATDLVRSVERFERAFTFSWMSRKFSCAMFGSGDLSAWGCRAKPLGFVKHEDQAAAYAKGRIGLNAMRWQDDVGSNIKPLEISASGRVCVMKRRSGVSELLEPGREIEEFEELHQGAAIVKRLLDDESARKQIASAALTRTLKDHTWTNRASAFLQAMGLA